MHESWNTLKRYVNFKKRGEHRLDFAEAISNAESDYNNHFKEWNKKQRNIAEMDTFEAHDLSQNSEIDINFEFINNQLIEFIEHHKQSKYFIRKTLRNYRLSIHFLGIKKSRNSSFLKFKLHGKIGLQNMGKLIGMNYLMKHHISALKIIVLSDSLKIVS